ncbi:potassium transporter [Nocardia cyriacigeorgica]|uniref:potassium transporter n=1 Tax=Nocardia cyriacigeorgica TaxID=135487 RepID=UPI0013BC3B4D|nr:potassium transporter [Nocardia cyriacigeorgica]NEW49340.1 potassium transporter [Nocardia cyriacigeorgica]
MQLSPRVESWSAGNLSWLGSAHGTNSARTVTINITAAAAKITNGVIKSGEPLAIVSGLAVPYASGASDGSQILAGFLLTDVAVVTGAGNVVAPLLDHGRVILTKLPSAVAANATTSGQFVFV